MKTIQYFITALAAVLLTSCLDDKTTTGGIPVSDITIDASSIKESYEMDKGDILTIDPVVTQTIEGKELSYKWEVEHSVYSTDKVLKYECKELGSFMARLIVSNEDGSTFYPFTINVNSPYEEGVLIISNDHDGKSMVSFMLHHTDGSVVDEFDEGDCFLKNNPEVHFSSYVSDVIQSDGNVILCCKGDGTTSNPSLIYYLNDKTFDVENFVNTSEYPDFKPLKMFVCATGFGGTSYPILSENGDLYEFASTEGLVIKSSKMPYKYDRSTAFYDAGGGSTYSIVFWDTEISAPVQIYNGYGPYYCVPSRDDAKYRERVTSSNNMFYGQGLQQMFTPQLTVAQALFNTQELYVLSYDKSSGALYRTILDVSFWSMDKETYETIFAPKERLRNIGTTTDALFDKTTPFVASGLYKAVYLGKGNKIYRWYYASNMLTDSASPYTTIGNANMVITSMALSQDQKTIYVAAYDSTVPSGLNGYLYTINTESGQVVNEYKNIAYKPTKVIYKKKKAV